MPLQPPEIIDLTALLGLSWVRRLGTQLGAHGAGGGAVSKADSYLEFHGGSWRVTVSVPRRLQKKLGATKLKRSLKTDSRKLANSLKWPVVAEFKKQIRIAAQGTPNDPLLGQALAMRDELRREQSLNVEPAFSVLDGIEIYAEQLLGDPVGEDEETGGPLYDPERERQAGYFSKVATGQATPLTALVEQWHSQEINRKERTRGDDRRALGYLEAWCKANAVHPTVEAIKRKVAGRFIADLPTIATSAKGGPPLTGRTVNKYVTSLSGYWKWLAARGMTDENVWRGQFLPKERVETEDGERPFTDDEVRKLLAGDPPMKALGPLMRIAALIGARIDAIASLRVKDSENGTFRFKRQKRESKERFVPIHSALVPLVEELTRAKGPDDDLFPEFPVPPPGSQRERSMPAVKAFGRYRRSVGVDERRPGRKRSLVNFHSFRRWFITKAEQAGINGDIIAFVVGQKRSGMTLGLYSGGPTLAQMGACVEAVKLPE